MSESDWMQLSENFPVPIEEEASWYLVRPRLDVAAAPAIG